MTHADKSGLSASIKKFELKKFDGEHEKGDNKRPVEIIRGGDGLPTELFRYDEATDTMVFVRTLDTGE